MSVQFSIPLGATAAISANTAPVMGKVNRYNATAAPRSVTLPALSGLNVGAVVGIEKDTLDVSSNAVTATRAGSDTFDDATTSASTTTPGTKLYLQVVSIASVKYWKVVDGYTPGGSTGEPTITAGTTSQYWRGDKTFQTLDKTAVGLGASDNTSDATKNSATAALTNKDLTSGTNTFPTLNQNTTGSAGKLTTARNINGVAFDGTAAITVADATKEPIITAGSTAQYLRGDKSLSTFNTDVRANSLDQMTAPAADVSVNSHKLTSVSDPVNPQDAATKNYSDTVLTTATGRAIAFAIALA
jgi:hypothetical protein